VRIHASQVIDDKPEIVDFDLGRGEFWPFDGPNTHNAIQLTWGQNHCIIDFDNHKEALEFAAKIIEWSARRIDKGAHNG
jgi:hypothetical protein